MLPPVTPGTRVVGPAVTVRNIQRVAQIHKAATVDKTNTQGETEAHNLAEPGDVLVIQGVMGCFSSRLVHFVYCRGSIASNFASTRPSG